MKHRINRGKLQLPALMAVIAGTLCAPPSHAQSVPSRSEFEVASLKSNTSGVPGYSIRALPGGLTARNINLKRLIAVAYSVTDYQIFGSLTWLESGRFDLEAKSPGPAQLPQLRPMVQSMLEDRFKLKIHRENRELPIYSLTLAKSGVKGPGLVESAAGLAAPSRRSRPRPPRPVAP